MYFKKETMRKILKDAGASRISDSAISSFQDILDKEAYKIAIKSINFAAHAKRKTIKDSDIKLAGLDIINK